MDLVFLPVVALLLACPQRRWAMLGGACSATAAFAGCWMFAVLFVVIALDPWVNGMRRARLRRRNVERAAAAQVPTTRRRGRGSSTRPPIEVPHGGAMVNPR